MFVEATLTRPVQLRIQRKTNALFEQILSKDLGGKCVPEGYVKPGSIKVVQTSYPELVSNEMKVVVEFKVLLADPAQLVGTMMECVVQTISVAGLKCRPEVESPYLVYLPRDHRTPISRLNSFKVGDPVRVKCVAHRYEINSSSVDILAALEEEELSRFSGTTEFKDFTTKDIQDNPDKIFVVEIFKKRAVPETNTVVFRLVHMKDSELEENKEAIDGCVAQLRNATGKAKIVVFPNEGVGQVLREKSPLTHAYLVEKLLEFGHPE